MPQKIALSERSHTRLIAYVIAIASSAICLLARWLLWPALGNTVPHMAFFPAVLVAAYFGGFWPGIVATILSASAANYFLTGQFRSFHITDVNDVAALILFLFVGTIISGLSESLHRSRRRFRDLVNSIEGIVWEADPATLQFSFVSMQAERLLGYPQKLWLSQPTFWKEHVHPEDRELVQNMCEKTMTEKGVQDFEYRWIAADGRIVWVRDTVNVAVEGDRTNLRGVMVDITSRKAAEEALSQAQADLTRVNRVTRMGELTASLAHEIKQPITAAVTNAKTCLRWLTRDQPDLNEARDATSRTVKDVILAADIINRVQSMFQNSSTQREVLDINEVIREMIVLLRGEATRHGVSIHSELARELPTTTADRVQLQQVFMNLMLNGIDAMEDMDSPRQLTIKSRKSDNGELLISVEDTGVGLPAGQADQIFKAFFTTKPQGTGMGLRISRSIIEGYGGRLWALPSNSGRGSTFQFSLPSTARGVHSAE